jgi:hypothetical protein
LFDFLGDVEGPLAVEVSITAVPMMTTIYYFILWLGEWWGKWDGKGLMVGTGATRSRMRSEATRRGRLSQVQGSAK